MMSHVISSGDSLVQRGRTIRGESKFRLLTSRRGVFVVARFWCVVRRVTGPGRGLYWGGWSVSGRKLGPCLNGSSSLKIDLHLVPKVTTPKESIPDFQVFFCQMSLGSVDLVVNAYTEKVSLLAKFEWLK
jgi:hypothetical protein